MLRKLLHWLLFWTPRYSFSTFILYNYHKEPAMASPAHKWCVTSDWAGLCVRNSEEKFNSPLLKWQLHPLLQDADSVWDTYGERTLATSVTIPGHQKHSAFHYQIHTSLPAYISFSTFPKCLWCPNNIFSC